MMNFFVIFLCNTLLHLFLLEDRYPVATTMLASAVSYVLSVFLMWPISLLAADTGYAQAISLLANFIVLFASSLFIYKNNIAHKLYLSVLCLSNYYFLYFFSESLLGMLPFQTAGRMANVFTAFICMLFYLLMGMSLYKVFHYFSDRSSSGFMTIIIIVQLIPCVVLSGMLNFMFGSYLLTGKLVACMLIYLMVIFSFRSVYTAAKFREETNREFTKKHLFRNQADRFVEVYALTHEHQRICREQEYVLDAITLMVRDDVADKIPMFIKNQRSNQGESIFLKTYHDNPYLNAILMSYAAYSKENNISFETNVKLGDKRFPISEICIMTNEILTKACQEAKNCESDARVRYSVSPAKETLRVEVVYSYARYSGFDGVYTGGRRTGRKSFSLSKMFAGLLTDSTKTAVKVDLEQTRELVEKYSGSMDVSSTDNDIIIRISLYY